MQLEPEYVLDLGLVKQITAIDKKYEQNSCRNDLSYWSSKMKKNEEK